MNETKNDGGPAFPTQWMDFQPLTGEQVVREQYAGLTMRDWFAGKALVGILSNHELLLMMDKLSKESTAKVASANAYQIADAMLKARGQ